VRVIPPLSHRCGEAARDLFVREICGEMYGGEGVDISLGGERDLSVIEKYKHIHMNIYIYIYVYVYMYIYVYIYIDMCV